MLVEGKLNTGSSPTKTYHLNTWLKTPKYFGTNDVRIYRDIYLRLSGTNAQLVKMKSDGVTESVINIHASLPAAYTDTFRILRVHIVHSSQIFIEYKWSTSDVAESSLTGRLIWWKQDGSLSQAGEYSCGVVSNDTQTSYGAFTRSLMDNSIEKRYYTVTRATGNTAIYYQNSYSAWGSSISFQTAIVNVASAAGVGTPNFDICVSKGGLLYETGRGTSNYHQYIALNMGYYGGGTRRLDLSTQSPEITTAQYCYVLGFNKNGFLTIVQHLGGVYSAVNLYDLDLSSSSGKILKHVGVINIRLSSNANIIAFSDDVLIFSNGQRFQLKYNSRTCQFSAEELSALDITHINDDPFDSQGADMIWDSQSDLWEGVIVY